MSEPGRLARRFSGGRAVAALAAVLALVIVWVAWFIGSLPFRGWHPGLVLIAVGLGVTVTIGALPQSPGRGVLCAAGTLAAVAAGSALLLTTTRPSATVLAAELRRLPLGSPCGPVTAHQGSRVLTTVGRPTLADARLSTAPDSTALTRAQTALLSAGWRLTATDAPSVAGGHELVASRSAGWGAHYTVSVVLPDGFSLPKDPGGQPLVRITGNRGRRL